MDSLEKKLQVRNLRISFRTNGGKVQAVRGISFDLHKGETLAIVGESGSGKSVTSKAILGIQAGNAIVDDGEILYDGQDLLKITEEDFYRLRGDKIAMIFQDPLSSLNPIMRIGKQLTEAMLLKGKARQRTSRENFRTKLNLLEKYMISAEPGKAEQIKEKCSLFRKIEDNHTALELAYNEAYEAAEDALEESKEMLFLIEKNAVNDTVTPGAVKDWCKKAVNPYVVSDRADEFLRASAQIPGGKLTRVKDTSTMVKPLETIVSVLSEATARSKPDFFAIGYMQAMGRVDGSKGVTKAECEAFARELHSGFLDDFEALASAGLSKADAEHLELRREVVSALNDAIAQLEKGTVDAFRPTADKLMKLVDASIDPIDIVKDSAACTFAGSMRYFLNRYQEGARTNGRKEAKYKRQMAKYEKRAAKGKDWKVAAPTVIDLELVKHNILGMMAHLRDHYMERNAVEAQEDKLRKTERLIDYLKENASGMVKRISKSAAKNKALKLMAEVGISEPRKRYRQYPFEFSGGMRQRIVIAIALAANPDILICDEPTTALDVTIQAQILELINKLKKDRNLSIIFITHDLGVVANMADRIAVMYAGKIVEYGTAEEIFYSPAHPYTWALLSSMPDLDTKEKLEAIPGTPPNMIYPPKGDAFAERNRYAMKIDFEREPPKFPISDTHWAATWLLHKNAPKVDPPKIVMNRIAKMKSKMEEEKAHG